MLKVCELYAESGSFMGRILKQMMLWLMCALLTSGAQGALASEFGGSDPFAPQGEQPLPAHEAFVLSHVMTDDDTLLLRWEMPDDYYLYKHRFKFETRENARVALGVPQIPPGKEKYDEFEGDVEVYYHEVEIRLPVSLLEPSAEIGVGYQGCNEKLGICYPPERVWLTVGEPTQASDSPPAGSAAEDGTFTSALQNSSVLVIMGLFLAAGIGLAFTPCVLPMVPILSGIIVGEGEGLSRRRAFTLSLAYVLGMAVTYALVGTLVGLFGAELNLQAKLQSPPVLIGFAIVFVVLSFAMFGFYELQLPSALTNRLNDMGSRQGGGKHVSVLIMGALSSLVVSPCVSAPLTGALVYISQTEDAVLGGLALLSLGLGMGVPLLLVGAGGGQLLPRAGAWMDTVKAVFGVLLLGVAVWLLERVVPPSVTLGLWAALLIGSGVYMGALDTSPRAGWGQLWKATGFMGLVYGVLLLIGAASGASDPLRPLAPLLAGQRAGAAHEASESTWHAVNNLTELQAQVAASEGKPAMLDLYADWCISCKIMERDVFPQPQIASRFENFRLIRADITDNDEAHQALLNRFGLFGPPSLLFFSPDGSEIKELRIQGEVGEAALATHLDAVLARI